MNQELLEQLSLHLSQARAMAICTTEMDWQNLCPTNFQDYLSILLDILDRANDNLKQLFSSQGIHEEQTL